MSRHWRAPGPRPHGWLLALGLPVLLWILLRPPGRGVEVVGKTWRWSIEIERQVMEMHSDWCSQMPAGAELIERRLRQDPEGQRGDAEHCRYRAPAWRKSGQRFAEGAHPEAPHWPALSLQAGLEREGKRWAEQALLLRDADGRDWPCRLPLRQWQAWAVGDRTRLAVHRFSGVADCASLPAAPR